MIPAFSIYDFKSQLSNYTLVICFFSILHHDVFTDVRKSYFAGISSAITVLHGIFDKAGYSCYYSVVLVCISREYSCFFTDISVSRR